MRSTWIAVLGLTLAALVTGESRGDVILLQSGNGPAGTPDALIRYHSFGNLTGNTPTAADFVAAQNGTFATTWPTGSNGWDPLPDYPDVRGSGSPNGLSALYAIPFVLGDDPIGSASIDFQFHVDNYLGGLDITAQGLYLNGIALSGDTRFVDPGGAIRHFSGDIFRDDISPLLIVGSTNWLYMNVTDRRPNSGIQFGAVITTSAAVPEPSSLALAATGLLGGLGLWRKRSRSLRR